MDFLFHDFRNAGAILEPRTAWREMKSVIHGVSADDVLAMHAELSEGRQARGQRPYAGGQAAVNALLDRRLTAVGGWVSQPHLFKGNELENWKMDFLKEGIGVEVSFNHAEAIPWQFTRLNIAGESERVVEEHRIEVGIVICAGPSLKAWARMDGAVGTFHQFRAWLREMRPILPVPLMLIGLEADGWPQATAFRGTDVGSRTRTSASGVDLP
jgi:hypothetical protein